MSTRRERGTVQRLIPQDLVQQASSAAFWHRLISAFFAVVTVNPEALPLELLPLTRRDDQRLVEFQTTENVFDST